MADEKRSSPVTVGIRNGDDLVVEYKFNIVAGKGSSSCDSLADVAYQKAKEFFGDREFFTHVEVSGKKDEYYVQCVAQAKMKR